MDVAKPTVAIIGGTGTLGSGLARRLARAGYPIVIGSRSQTKAAEAARSLQPGRGVGAGNAAAAMAGDILIITLPWSNAAPILDEIAPHAAGKLVIETTVPLAPAHITRVSLPPEGSAALAAQKRLSGARLVAAFHHVAAHKLMKDDPIDCDVLVFGDDRGDRQAAVDLVAAVGLKGVHAGPLANAVAAEALTSVLIGINRTYKVDGAGIRITGIG
jgi:NADPH-dependent F420 reductase